MISTKSIIAGMAIAAFSLAGIETQAQKLNIPAASPAGSIKQSVGLSEISIDYSRPGVKGRVIFGDLVPYGKTWRTGANSSTKITFGEDSKLEGTAVPAGTYALYTIPDKDEWTIILSKNTTLWGDFGYKQDEDLLRVKVKPTALNYKVETFTINFADVTSNSANIELLWDQTRVAFKVTVDVDTKVMKNIESTMAKDQRPYTQAANYYYDNDKDLKQALTWVNKDIEQNPKSFSSYLLQAKINYKLKDKVAGKASADKTIQLATDAKNDDYVKMAQKLIADNK